MYFEEFDVDNKRLNKIIEVLKNDYDIELDLNESSDDTVLLMNEMLETWNAVKTKILLESPYNTYNNNPQYTKASLICEAIKLFLSEIAPARKGAKVRTKKMQKMGEAQMTAKDKTKAGGPTDREFEKFHDYPEKDEYSDEDSDEDKKINKIKEAAVLLTNDSNTQREILTCALEYVIR